MKQPVILADVNKLSHKYVAMGNHISNLDHRFILPLVPSSDNSLASYLNYLSSKPSP